MLEQLQNLFEEGKFEDALIMMEKSIYRVLEDKSNLTVFIDTPDIDRICQAIGHSIFDSNIVKNTDINKKLNIYITGSVYINGGHTREIEDWIETVYSDRENIIILTNPIEESHKDQIKKFNSREIKIISYKRKEIESRLDRIIWLQNKLARLRPYAIFVSTTPADTVSLAALQKPLINKLYWNLSLDHGPSIGIHIDHITKIIVKRPYLYFYIKEKLKLDNLTYVPFNRVDVVGGNSFFDSVNEKLITASCTSSSHKIEAPYCYKFIDIIPNILKITEGKHIHIGAISESALQSLYAKMDMMNIDRNKFLRIEFVSSVAKALVKNKVDIVLQTFPVGGGLVTIEAMQAAMMIINHKNYNGYISNVSDFCYEGAFAWKDPEDLYSFLENLDIEEIILQKKNSRKCYEKYHNSDDLKQVSNIDNIVGIEIDNKKELIANMYSYGLDYYKSYFDYNSLENSKNISPKQKPKFGKKIIKSCKKRIKIIKKLFGYNDSSH